MIAQKTTMANRFWATVMAAAPMAYPSRPITYARLRPKRSPILLPIRMNAADTSASSAIAPWTPLTVVPRSRTTEEIDTFMIDVSTTSTNIAIASKMASRRFMGPLVGPFVSMARLSIEDAFLDSPTAGDSPGIAETYGRADRSTRGWESEE